MSKYHIYIYMMGVCIMVCFVMLIQVDSVIHIFGQ